MRRAALALLVALSIAGAVAAAQTASLDQARSGPEPVEGALPAVNAAAALKTVVPDLDSGSPGSRPFACRSTRAGLSARERQMVDQLVIACRYLESMLLAAERSARAWRCTRRWQKVDTPLARNTRHYLFINGSRLDLVDENRPFVGTEPMPPGHALYPTGPDARADRGVRRGASRTEGGDLQPLHGGPLAQGTDSGGTPVSRGVRPFLEPRPPRCARPRRCQRRRGVRQVPAPARRRAADRRLLRERPRVARPARTRSST